MRWRQRGRGGAERLGLGVLHSCLRRLQRLLLADDEEADADVDEAVDGRKADEAAADTAATTLHFGASFGESANDTGQDREGAKPWPDGSDTGVSLATDWPPPLSQLPLAAPPLMIPELQQTQAVHQLVEMIQQVPILHEQLVSSGLSFNPGSSLGGQLVPEQPGLRHGHLGLLRLLLQPLPDQLLAVPQPQRPALRIAARCHHAAKAVGIQTDAVPAGWQRRQRRGDGADRVTGPANAHRLGGGGRGVAAEDCAVSGGFLTSQPAASLMRGGVVLSAADFFGAGRAALTRFDLGWCRLAGRLHGAGGGIGGGGAAALLGAQGQLVADLECLADGAHDAHGLSLLVGLEHAALECVPLAVPGYVAEYLQVLRVVRHMGWCMSSCEVESSHRARLRARRQMTLTPSTEIDMVTLRFLIALALNSKRIRRMAATISTRLCGRGTSRLPMNLALYWMPRWNASSECTGNRLESAPSSLTISDRGKPLIPQAAGQAQSWDTYTVWSRPSKTAREEAGPGLSQESSFFRVCVESSRVTGGEAGKEGHLATEWNLLKYADPGLGSPITDEDKRQLPAFIDCKRIGQRHRALKCDCKPRCILKATSSSASSALPHAMRSGQAGLMNPIERLRRPERQRAGLGSNNAIPTEAPRAGASLINNQGPPGLLRTFNERAGPGPQRILPNSPSSDAIAFVEDVEPEFDLAECLEKPGFEADRLHQLLASLDELASVAKGDGEAGGSTVVEARLAALSGVRRLLDEAWRTPRWGRDYGTALCDRLRQESLLRTLESVIGEHQLGSSQDLVLAATGLLGQALTRENIGSLGQDTVRCVVALGLQAVHTEDALACATVAVLEALLKHSAAMCSTVLKLGGLDLLLRACQARDPVLQRHCAQALANLALFGDREAHRLMAAQKVADWLFPLAFTHDQLANAVASSGTLQLVRPWLLSHSPAEFRQSDEGHAQGRSAGWLQRLMTLLACDQAEAQALAAFHFAMEAVVKQEQAKAGLFADIGALPLLRRTAASTNHLAARFATQALETLGEELPHRFPAAACLWSERDVQLWLQQVGFPELVDRFSRSRVDGDLLLRITDADLRDSIGLSNGLLRQRLMREIDQLRTSTDYSPCDPSGLAGWLRRCVGQDSVQFAYALLTAGCDRRLLASASDAMLADAGVSGAVHRLRILRAASRQPEPAPGPDVFVSYRREGGALLASLLRVHLQLRGHTVFLDVYRLPSGRFDDQLLHSIANTRNFIVVLTPGALDRCIGDNDGADWLHKELSVALSSGCNIIPVLDPGFVFPDPDQLPEDIRCLQAYNSVPWKHEYQDACIAKIESFLVKASQPGPAPPRTSSSRTVGPRCRGTD
uniref:ADP-ribosyl cyclase/cyclic ADP-ribose hydrolase n=1 Tax=Macrostomum lignano TaxID=282301 RepID=A0A1I8ING7_9PLAT